MVTTQKTDGFTLIELMVTIAITAIVITMGIPSFQTTIANNRIVTQTNGLIAALNLTRSEAVKRRTTATICIAKTSGSNLVCDTANSQWENGWVVFVDANDDGNIDPTEIIKTGDKLTGNNTLRSVATSEPGVLRYTSRGRVDAADAWVLCHGNDALALAPRVISVAGTGRSSAAKGSTSQCP